MPLFITKLNPSDRIRVGGRPHIAGVAPPKPTWGADITGRDILLPNIPTDRQIQFDNQESVLRKSITAAELASADTAPLNISLPSFGWGTYASGSPMNGERNNHTMLVYSGEWIVADDQAVTYVTELIHPDTTVLATGTDTTTPDTISFNIGDQLHGLELIVKVTATYDVSGQQTVVSAPVPVPDLVPPPNLWLSMLNDEDTAASPKGIPDFSFTFDPVTGDTTCDFPTDPPRDVNGDITVKSPRVSIGGSLDSLIPHDISFEIHAASESNADLLKLVIGTSDQIPLPQNRGPLSGGFVTVTKTMRPTESGNFRFDFQGNFAPGTVEIRNVSVKET